MDTAAADSDLTLEGEQPGIVAPYSQVEFVFHLGDAWRMRREGQSGWKLRPPAFVYAQSRGLFRFEGESGRSVITFRVSPIVASSLLSRPPVEIWNEPVAFPDVTGSAGRNVRELFYHVLRHPPFEHLDMLSTELGWSPRGLRRLFATSATLSAQDVKLLRRHLDACALLRERPDLEVAQIALQAGFADYAAFTHSFCERIGLAPPQLRNERHAFYERRS